MRSPRASANGRRIEVGAGRLLPWFAVAFGAGIVLYFTAEHEPAVWAASGLAIVAIVAAVLLRRRPLGFVLALGFLGIAAGFADRDTQDRADRPSDPALSGL